MELPEPIKLNKWLEFHAVEGGGFEVSAAFYSTPADRRAAVVLHDWLEDLLGATDES